ncbi:MAG: hypothetical protein Q8O42_20805 [Acidobacteriota bacterium]|nr:hypothetical protein [Acidobacteriota bacterium]
MQTVSPAGAGPPAAAADARLDAVVTRMAWRSVGPAVMSGRIADIAVVETDPQIWYSASASGGLWKTINNGTTFDPIFDQAGSISLGDVAVAPSDPNVVWAGTGEANNRNSSSWGDGVYKSTDAGKTWTNMGLKDSHHVGRIVIHPKDPNIVYVAAVGRLWGHNKERGVFKTIDGGRTWTHSLFLDERTGAQDLAMDPSDPNTLYAAMYERLRTAYSFKATGPGSGIHKSTDGGKTWRKLSKGLPTEQVGRIGLDIYRKSPSVIYAVIECDAGGTDNRVEDTSKEGGVFRSDDKGETWQRLSNIVPRPFFHGQIRVDPTDDQRVWVLGGSVFASTDGGRTFTTGYSGVHGDHHAMWINPLNSRQLMLGTDAGVYVSYDRGARWTRFNTFPLGQYYAIGVDMQKPYHIYGGLQDNGIWGSPSRTTDVAGITHRDAYKVYGGDGMSVQIDPTDADTIYASWHSGTIARIDRRTGRTYDIKPQPKEGTQELRHNWAPPLVMSPHDPTRLYFGANRLIKLDDRGDRWSFISPDLTTNDAAKIPAVVWRRSNPGYAWSAEMHCTIVTVAESPVTPGVIWVGTDDGNVQLTRDGGNTWTNLTSGLPAPVRGLYVSRVEASHHDDKVAYVTLDGHRSNNFEPHVFMTSDSGKTWRSIHGNLPAFGSTYVIREDHRNPNLLFVGTEFGIFASIDRGHRWTQLNAGLPTISVWDALIHPRDNDLVIGTHGRSIWVLDITPLQELTPKVLESAAHLFDVKPATVFQPKNWNDWSNVGNQMYAAANPPFGAVINYYVGKPLAQDVRVTITDNAGSFRRELTGRSYAGLNQVAWDFRETAGALPAERRNTERTYWEDYAQGLVEPGEYTATLAAGDVRVTKKFIVEPEPVLAPRRPATITTTGSGSRQP